MKCFKNLVALLLIVAFGVMNITACGTEVTNETILANGDVDIAVDMEGTIVLSDGVDWYHLTEYSVESEYEDDHYNQVINDVINATDTTLTTLVTGFLINSDGITFGNEGFDQEFVHLLKYDFTTGEKLFFLDLSDYQRYIDDEDGQQSYVCLKALETTDYYYVIYDYSNFTNDIYEHHVLKIDNQTGEIVSDTIPANLNDNVSNSLRIFGSAVDGSKVVMLTGQWGSEPPYISSGRIILYDVTNDELQSCPLGVTLTANNAVHIDGVRRIDDTYYGIIAYALSYEPLCLLYNVETNETQLLDMSDAMSDITDDITGLEFGSPINTFSNVLTVQGEDYVAILDTSTMKFYKSFDTNHCNINSYLFEKSIGSVESNSDYTVMVDGLFGYADGLMGVFLINRLESNPYEGRKLLTASALGRYTSYVENEIIYRFNENSDEYYIAIDNSYVDGEYDYNTENITYIRDSSDMTSQLTVDLMSGAGPDIILDGFEFDELNNSNSLLDLTPYLQDTSIFDSSLYSTNAFELATNENGELYQIPVNLMISGIGYPIESVDDYQTVGFTFDEYIDFVSNVRNGWDPVAMRSSQIDYFVTCFNAMRDEFISNGEINLQNDAFYDLAIYVNDNVNGGYTIDEYYESGASVVGNGYIYAYNTNVIGSFYEFYMNGNLISYRGLPSNDGRGPQLNVSDSIGISSSCDEVDGAIEFILYALGEESQQLYADYYYSSLNISCMRNGLYRLRDAIEAESEIRFIEDETYQLYYHYYTDDEVEEVVNLYVAMINNASGFLGGDSDISIILYEEMPAYFCGDKRLEDVIDIIESRAQTVLDERG